MAYATLHTVSQGRWSNKGPVQQAAEAYFLDPAADDQAPETGVFRRRAGRAMLRYAAQSAFQSF